MESFNISTGNKSRIRIIRSTKPFDKSIIISLVFTLSITHKLQNSNIEGIYITILKPIYPDNNNQKTDTLMHF